MLSPPIDFLLIGRESESPNGSPAQLTIQGMHDLVELLTSLPACWLTNAEASRPGESCDGMSSCSSWGEELGLVDPNR